MEPVRFWRQFCDHSLIVDDCDGPGSGGVRRGPLPEPRKSQGRVMTKSPRSAHSARPLLAAMLLGGLAWLVAPVVAQTASYPDASNTGVPPGTTLTPVTGDVQITVNGTVYEGKFVTGSITVTASNVIIRNCKVSAGGIYAVRFSGGTGNLIEDCELDGSPGGDGTFVL